MITGVQYAVSDAGLVFKLVKDDVTSEFYWITDTLPDQKFKQVFVPIDFDDPAIVA